MKLISVIVPVYNVEKYIRDCIESIINQSSSNLEIILVDDGSTDASGQICDQYAARDFRIKVIHKSNGGLVSARKAGLAAISGEYVITVDGDDYILPDMCEKMLEEALDYNVDVVDCCYFRSDKNTVNKNNVQHEIFELGKTVTAEMLLMDWMTSDVECRFKSPVWSKLYKTDIIKESYSKVPDDASFGEDWINFLYLLKIAKKICILPESYYIYRVRKDSISHFKSRTNYIKKQRLDLKIIDIIETEYPNMSQENIQQWYCKQTLSAVNCLPGMDLAFNQYSFDAIDKIRGKKVILYGAGKVGVNYYTQFRRYRDIDIVAWIDKNPLSFSYEFGSVEVVEVGLLQNYDYIVVAVLSEDVATEIRKELQDRGVEGQMVLWVKPVMAFFQ